MKYANNHPWLFRSWKTAYVIGFCQFLVVFTVELVNLAILTTNNTVMDILMNFLALVIISEFDDYFLVTVEGAVFEQALSNGDESEIKVKDGGTKKIEDVLRIRVTTSKNARFKIPENRLDYDSDDHTDDKDDPIQE